MPDLTAQEALRLWLVELSNAGRSPKTIQAYRADVVAVLRWCSEFLNKGLDELSLGSVNRDHLSAAIADYRTRPDARYRTNPQKAPAVRSAASVGRRQTSLQGFFAWAYRTDRIARDPAATLPAVKVGARLPKALDVDGASRAVAAAANGRWPERDVMAMVLFLTSGLRLEEVATLRHTQMAGLRLDDPEALATALRVIGKGNKERELPLAPVAQRLIAAYLPTRQARLLGMTAETLLISTRRRVAARRQDGSPVMTIETSRSGLRYVVDRSLAAAGTGRKGAHVLRHTFATLALRPDPETGKSALSIRELQAALGHADLSTLTVYTQVADADLRRGIRAHPLSQ